MGEFVQEYFIEASPLGCPHTHPKLKLLMQRTGEIQSHVPEGRVTRYRVQGLGVGQQPLGTLQVA